MTKKNIEHLVIDNQDGNTMASVLVEHLKSLKEDNAIPEELQISTAFFNPYGFNLIAKELEYLPKIKLLLGAEPQSEVFRKDRLPGDPHNFLDLQIEKNISYLDTALRERRNSLPFNVETDNAIRNLLKFLNSTKIEVRRYTRRFLHAKAFLFLGDQKQLITGSSNLTYAGLKNNIELNLGITNTELLEELQEWYANLWNDAEPYDLSDIYKEIFDDYSPYQIYLLVLWQLYGEELQDEVEEEGGIKLSRFQQHGVNRALRILDKYHGVMIADGVGLGKTYTGLAIMQTFVEKKERVLVICPAALCNMWNGVLSDSQLFSEVISYNKFRDDSQFGGINDYLKRNIEEYALVVIDEAHNYRSEDTDNSKALRELLRQRKKLVLLTATPVNNGIMDLRILLSYFLKQDASLSDEGITSLMEIFKTADSIEPGKLNPDILYPIIDSTTVKRPRNFVKEFYSNDTLEDKDGQPFTITFPKPIPKKVTYELSELNPNFFDELKNILMPETGEPKLTLARYKADNYLKGKRRLIRVRGLRKNTKITTKMELDLSDQSTFLFQATNDNPLGLVLEDAFKGLKVIEIDKKISYDFEIGDIIKSINGKKTRQLNEIKTVLSSILSISQENAASGLLRSNLLKRFESSIHSFSLTLERLTNSYIFFIETIKKGKVPLREYFQEFSINDDHDDIDFLLVNENIMEDISHYDIERFKSDLENDLQILINIQKEINTNKTSSKLIALKDLLKSIIQKAEEDSIDEEDARQKRKVMIFSFFEETTDWIKTYLEQVLINDSDLAPYKNRLVVVSGKTKDWEGFSKDEAINRFTPISMEAKEGTEDKYDLMICTDVLAEGLNLQQCRNIINYDLPWNPMRLVQRHGRIDRLKSPHNEVYMYSFFPDNRLDDLLQLEQRIRNKIAIASASIGVEVSPIVDGSQSEIIFSDSIKEIQKIYEEDASIFEKGGTDSITQTGEIYRAELRRAINQKGIDIQALPNRIGSGLRKSVSGGHESGFFFCARVAFKDNDETKIKTLLRFVQSELPEDEDEGIITELATCLRIIECSSESTGPSIDNFLPEAYEAWDKGKKSIFKWWQSQTDPANLQPKIPKINRNVSNFLEDNPPSNINQEKLNTLISSVEAPWRERDCRLLRETWKLEFSSNQEKAEALCIKIEQIGVEPYIAPKPLVSIEEADIDLVCWMYIESGN
jgi:ERCC4-related helicase